MPCKKNFKFFLKLLGTAALFLGLHFFCEHETKGFRPYLILSNLPNDSRWEAPPLSMEEQQHVNLALDQRFTFLGSGGWCYAFLGEDQKTVLKFFRHSHLLPSSIIKDFSFEKLMLKSQTLPSNSNYSQEFNFNSCMLLLKQAKERSGLLYVHLNKTQGLHKPIVIIDNIGACHRIDLDKTEFVIQKKADLIIPHLEYLIGQNRIEEVKQKLDDMIVCLTTLFRSGLRDYDASFRQNFGFVDGHAIALDLSSFGFDASLQDPAGCKKEVITKTKRLRHWLKKHHPDLLAYYDERIQLCNLE